MAKTIQKSTVNGQPKPRPAPKPIPVPRLKPTTTTKIVIATPDTTIKVKQQLRDLKLCPLCGLTLTPMISGSGVRNRKRCTRCNRTFI